MQGWSGLWIDGSDVYCDRVRSTHAHWIKQNTLSMRNAFITAENINDLIAARYANRDIDLLSVDIDFNDYWIWEAITTIRPRVVITEYNASWAPPVALTVPYNPTGSWNGTNYFGASLAAFAKLADRKGYDLVGCSLSGVNAFFVRKDLTGDKFLNPGSAEDHYEPARYYLSGLPSGHPAGIGPVVAV